MIETLTNEQLLILIKKLCRGGYREEQELEDDIDLLINNVPDSEVLDYIYSTKYKLTPEEILEKALSYKPIILPGPEIGNGKHKNFVKYPNPEAGNKPHIVANIGEDGVIKNYVVFEPNPKNPTGFDSVKRVDLMGKGHRHSLTQEQISTPHVHGKGITGGVRKALTEELPVKK